MKLWDLDTQHCFQTLVSHHREVWSIETVGGVSGGDVRLLAASGGSELKVYKLSREESDQSKVVVVEGFGCGGGGGGLWRGRGWGCCGG